MLDRDAAVAAWRQAEGHIYPSVMLNASLYQEYVAVIKGIADELADVAVRVDDLLGVRRHYWSPPKEDRACWMRASHSS